MEYSDIARVNSEIKMMNLKGKDYAMVAERVTAFRKLYPDGFIFTKILKADGDEILMEAEAGYYKDDGSKVVFGTGHAHEIRGKGSIANATSFIENCETSAVGRALGFLGLGINDGNISSVEEMIDQMVAKRQAAEAFADEANAIEADKLAVLGKEIKELRKDAPATVGKTDSVPIIPVADFIHSEVEKIGLLMGMDSYEKARKQVTVWVSALVKSGSIEPVDWGTMSMDEAVNMFQAIQETFNPGGRKGDKR